MIKNLRFRVTHMGLGIRLKVLQVSKNRVICLNYETFCRNLIGYSEEKMLIKRRIVEGDKRKQIDREISLHKSHQVFFFFKKEFLYKRYFHFLQFPLSFSFDYRNHCMSLVSRSSLVKVPKIC